MDLMMALQVVCVVCSAHATLQSLLCNLPGLTLYSGGADGGTTAGDGDGDGNGNSDNGDSANEIKSSTEGAKSVELGDCSARVCSSSTLCSQMSVADTGVQARFPI